MLKTKYRRHGLTVGTKNTRWLILQRKRTPDGIAYRHDSFHDVEGVLKDRDRLVQQGLDCLCCDASLRLFVNTKSDSDETMVMLKLSDNYFVVQSVYDTLEITGTVVREPLITDAIKQQVIEPYRTPREQRKGRYQRKVRQLRRELGLEDDRAPGWRF